MPKSLLLDNLTSSRQRAESHQNRYRSPSPGLVTTPED